MLIQNDTDKQWELFGKKDPYFGVITHKEFHKENLTDEAKDKFFATGQAHVERVLSTIRQKIDPDFFPKKVLDFGSGVGRLIIPFSQLAGEVTGMDVSDSMLAEARKNCDDHSIRNAAFVKSDDDCSNLSGKYDLIHSYIVFQHIPVKRGMKIFEKLLKHLEIGGVCAVHFSFGKISKIKRLLNNMEKIIPLLGNAINVLRGHSFFAPRLQMNEYDLNKIMKQIYGYGIDIYICK